MFLFDSFKKTFWVFWKYTLIKTSFSGQFLNLKNWNKSFYFFSHISETSVPFKNISFWAPMFRGGYFRGLQGIRPRQRRIHHQGAPQIHPQIYFIFLIQWVSFWLVSNILYAFCPKKGNYMYSFLTLFVKVEMFFSMIAKKSIHCPGASGKAMAKFFTVITMKLKIKSFARRCNTLDYINC